MGRSRPNFSPKLEPIHRTIKKVEHSLTLTGDPLMFEGANHIYLLSNNQLSEGPKFYLIVIFIKKNITLTKRVPLTQTGPISPTV